MTVTQYDRYAYGKDTIGDCPCPATAAGYTPGNGDASTTAAEWYDNLVRQMDYSTADSTLPEPDAKEAWLKTIDQLTHRYGPDSNVVETAEKIAEELGWL